MRAIVLRLLVILNLIILVSCGSGDKTELKNESTDSLQAAAVSEELPEIELLNEAIKSASSGKYDEAIGGFSTVIEFARKAGAKELELEATHSLAKAYAKKWQNDSSIYYFDKSIELSKSIGDTAEMAEIYFSKAVLYEMLPDFNEALKTLDLSIYFAKSVPDTDKTIRNYNKKARMLSSRREFAAAKKILENVIKSYQSPSSYFIMGNINFAESKYTDAVDNYQKAIELSDSVGDGSFLPSCYNNMGLILRQIGDVNKARQCFTLSLKENNRYNNYFEKSVSLENLGRIAHSKAKKAEALEYYNKALEINFGVKDTLRMFRNLNDIGMIHAKAHEYKIAIEYLLKALHLADALNKKELSLFIVNNIEEIYNKTGDRNKAQEYHNIKNQIMKDIQMRGSKK